MTSVNATVHLHMAIGLVPLVNQISSSSLLQNMKRHDLLEDEQRNINRFTYYKFRRLKL